MVSRHRNRDALAVAMSVTLSVALFADASCGWPASKLGDVAEQHSSATGAANSDLILQIGLATPNDSTACVAWLDQSSEGFRLWFAVAECGAARGVHWRPVAPALIAKPDIGGFQIVGSQSRLGIAYTVRGRLLYRAEIGEPKLETLNPDSDYVETFGAYRDAQGLYCVAIVSNMTDFDHVTHAVVSYRQTDSGVVRDQLARVSLAEGWASPAPVLTNRDGNLLALVGLNHGSFLDGGGPRDPGAVALMEFTQSLAGHRGWGPGRLLQINLGTASLAARQIGSLSLVPAHTPACLIANGGTHLVTWGASAFPTQAAPLTGPDATGDDIGQPRVTSIAQDSSHTLLAWIDAARQMTNPSRSYALGVNPSDHGGDIKFALLGLHDLGLRRSELTVLPAQTSAECVAVCRVGRRTLVAWGGPRWATAAPSSGRPEERIFLRLVPDASW